MHKAAFLFALVLSATFQHVHAQDQKSNKDLIGKWSGIDQKGKSGALEFVDSTKVILFIADTQMPPTDYTTDFSKNPIWLNLILKGNGQTRVIKCILQFVDPNELKWAFGLTDSRPKKFEADSTAIIISLKRGQ